MVQRKAAPSVKNVQIVKIHEILGKEVKKYKVPIVDLIKVQTKDPEKVLLTTILSARTNDKTTTDAARKLFKKVNKISDLKKLTIKQIERIIFPVGFYKNKARFLKQLPVVLEEKYDGVVPQTVEQLIELPGVGRKTANLVVAVGFNKPAICVDVHVNRIMNRLGYISTKNPLETEMVLRKKLPKKLWIKTNRILVAFGQNLCRPINPHCDICPVRQYCKRVGVK